MSLNLILKDKRIRSYDIECFDGEPDTYFFYITEGYESTWESSGTITDEEPFKYIKSMLKAKNGIIKIK
jgi:hypothetical protein